MEEEADAAGLADEVNPPDETALDDLQIYLTAFRRLLYDRHWGAFGGATRIFYTSISAYARDFGISGDEYEVFIRLIGELDDEYLEYLERSKPQTPPENPT